MFARGNDFVPIFVSPPLFIKVPVPSQEDVCLLGVMTLPLSLCPRHFLLKCLYQARKMFVRGIDFSYIFVSTPLFIEVPVPSQEDVCSLGY